MTRFRSLLQKFLTDCCRGIALLVFGILFALATANIQKHSWMSSFQKPFWLIALLCASSIGLYGTLYLARNLLRKLSAKGQSLVVIGIGLLIVLLQLAYIFVMKIQFRYDTMEVYEEACHLLKTGAIQNWDYYGANAHQRGTLYLTWGLLKLASIVHIPERIFVYYLDLWCVVFVDTSLLLTGALVGKKRGINGVILFAMISLFNPFTYLWCSFYYTTIECLPFMTIMLALAYLYDRPLKWYTRLILGFVIGVITFVGNLIRPTVLIALAAYFIFWCMKWLQKETQKNFNWKNIFLICGTIFLFTTGYQICNRVYQSFDEKIVTIDTSSLERPMLFWVAMAAKGDGTWDGNDAEILAGYPSIEEKQEVAKKFLIERLHDLNVSSAVKLIGNKMRVTWAEGNDDAISENATSLSYSKAFQLIFGNDSAGFLFFCQICRVLMLGSIFVSCILQFRKQLQKDTVLFDETDCAKTTVLGGVFFHILWEAKRLYSIPFMPALLVLMVDGMLSQFEGLDGFFEKQENSNRKYILVIPVWCAVVTLFYGTVQYGSSTQIYMEKNRLVTAQLMERCDIKKGLMPGEQMRQEFFASAPFDTIGVQVREYSWYYGTTNESKYKLTLTDEADNVLREVFILGDKMEDYAYADTSFDTVTPKKGGQLYRFTVEAVDGDADNYLVFYTKRADAIDPYPWGSYIENGVTMPQTDMTFRVLKKEEKGDFSKGGYIAFITMLLMLQGLAAIGICTKLQKKG